MTKRELKLLCKTILTTAAELPGPVRVELERTHAKGFALAALAIEKLSRPRRAARNHLLELYRAVRAERDRCNALQLKEKP